MAAVVTIIYSTAEEGRNAAPAAAVVPRTAATAEVERSTVKEGRATRPRRGGEQRGAHGRGLPEKGHIAAPTAGEAEVAEEGRTRSAKLIYNKFNEI